MEFLRAAKCNIARFGLFILVSIGTFFGSFSAYGETSTSVGSQRKALTQIARDAYSNACGFFDNALSDITHKSLLPFLEVEPYYSDDATVEFLGPTTDGYLGFLKYPGPWYSKHQTIIGSDTPQGDIRSSIFIFGPRMAYKLGTRTQTLPNGNVMLWFAGSRRLRKTVEICNDRLRAQGKEPITYLPVEAGFLGPEEMIDLSLRVDTAPAEDFFLYFPWDVFNHHLAAHEASFHLFFLLPKSMTTRAWALNHATKMLMASIRLHKKDLGSMAEELASGLAKERSDELDSGAGSLTGRLASRRMKSGLSSYRDIKRTIDGDPKVRAEFLVHVDDLAHPEMNPIDVVLQRLKLMIHAKHLRPLGFVNRSRTAEKLALLYPTQIYPNKGEMDILEKIFIDFQNLNATRQLRAATKTASIESIFDSFLLGLDQRIEDVTAALPNQTTLRWK